MVTKYEFLLFGGQAAPVSPPPRYLTMLIINMPPDGGLDQTPLICSAIFQVLGVFLAS